MKKLLITILIVLVLTLTIFTVVKGLELGSFEILGIKGIQEKSADLEKTITEVTKLASSEFPNKVTQLNTSMKKLKEEKTNYEDILIKQRKNEKKTTEHSLSTDGCRIRYFMWREETNIRISGLGVGGLPASGRR